MIRKPSGIAPSPEQALASADICASALSAGLPQPPARAFPTIIEARGLEQPDKVVFTWLGDAAPRDTTYGELLAASRRIAADIAAQVTPGERAVLFYQPGVDYIAAFLGCLLAGVIDRKSVV